MMKNKMNLLKFSAALAGAAILAFGSTAQADRFEGAGGLTVGDGISWEDPLNWLAGVVPVNNGSNILIGTDHQVVFDSDTWAALVLAGNTQNATEHRIARLLMGDNTGGAFNGTHSLTLDQGAGIMIRATNSNSAVIGGRINKHSTLNIVSGDTNLEANRIRVGQAVDGSGTINVSGGLLICGRGGLELSNPDGLGGDGTLNITGGSFRTRNDAQVFAGGTFHVAGSAPLDVGIGTHASVDGEWIQHDGGILRTGIDAGGFTAILVDDVDDDGAGAQGNVTFNAGSILDPYDMGDAAKDVWTTVMTWEGTRAGAPALSATSVAAGWESQIVGSDLQVRLSSTGGGLLGDVNLDGGVTFLDISPFIAILSTNGFQTEADINLDGMVTFLDIQPFIDLLAGN